MLADDAYKHVVRLTWNLTKFTAKVGSELIKEVLKQVNENPKTINGLTKQGKELDSIPVDRADLKDLKKEFKKYGVDFAVVKRPNNTVELYFKSVDGKQIKDAMENILNKKTLKREKPSIKSAMEKAIKKSLNLSSQSKSLNKNKVIDKGAL